MIGLRPMSKVVLAGQELEFSNKTSEEQAKLIGCSVNYLILKDSRGRLTTKQACENHN